VIIYRIFPFLFVMDKCGRCGKTVYPTEKVNAISKAWHKACFKCITCNSTIQLGTEMQHDGMPYCKRCHQSNFGIGGYGYGSGGTLNSHSYNTNVHQPPPSQAATSASKSSFCSSCGNPVTSSGNFCSSCGSRV